MAKKPKLGSGARFKALKAKLAKKPGITDPGALAASIGRKKYGKAKMAKMAQMGKMGGQAHVDKMYKRMTSKHKEMA